MSKVFTSKQIADTVGGILTGDETLQITYLAPPALATETMIAIAFEKDHIKALPETKAQCVLVPKGMAFNGKTCIEVERPKLAMGQVMSLFYVPPRTQEGIDPTAIVDETAQLGKNISVGPHVVIEKGVIIGDNVKIMANTYIGQGAKVGNDCHLYPSVFIGDRAILGNRVIIHHGATIGADGFSFVTEKAGTIEQAKAGEETGQEQEQIIVKIPSLGSVEIKDDVEIGAGACIDKGTLQNTIIQEMTKIDNLVQIGHNCDIGKACFIVSQVGISGSVKVGDRCVIAGQAGIADHKTIGEDSILMARAGVTGNVPPKSVIMGEPAVPRKEFVRNIFNVKSIDSIKKRLKELEETVSEKVES